MSVDTLTRDREESVNIRIKDRIQIYRHAYRVYCKYEPNEERTRARLVGFLVYATKILLDPNEREALLRIVGHVVDALVLDDYFQSKGLPAVRTPEEVFGFACLANQAAVQRGNLFVWHGDQVATIWKQVHGAVPKGASVEWVRDQVYAISRAYSTPASSEWLYDHTAGIYKDMFNLPDNWSDREVSVCVSNLVDFNRFTARYVKQRSWECWNTTMFVRVASGIRVVIHADPYITLKFAVMKDVVQRLLLDSTDDEIDNMIKQWIPRFDQHVFINHIVDTGKAWILAAHQVERLIEIISADCEGKWAQRCDEFLRSDAYRDLYDYFCK